VSGPSLEWWPASVVVGKPEGSGDCGIGIVPLPGDPQPICDVEFRNSSTRLIEAELKVRELAGQMTASLSGLVAECFFGGTRIGQDRGGPPP